MNPLCTREYLTAYTESIFCGIKCRFHAWHDILRICSWVREKGACVIYNNKCYSVYVAIEYLRYYKTKRVIKFCVN